MKLNRIIIENYKSVRHLEIEFNQVGTGKKKSFTKFLLGVNESGKTNILNAILCLKNGISEKYGVVCNKSSQEEELDVSITGIFSVSHKFFSSLTENLKSVPETIIPHIKPEEIRITKRKTANDKTSEDVYYDLESVPYSMFVIFEDNIILKKESKNFEGEGIVLTEEFLRQKIHTEMTSLIKRVMPDIIFWTPDERFLITAPIALSAFAANPKSNLPLRNIFFLYGIDSDDEITRRIQKTLNSDEKLTELGESLSVFLTNHVNNIWKELKINMKVVLDSGNIKFFIEDKDVKYKYYNMKNRSDGFKQFISLILSLSAESYGGSLNNNVILIDEPEQHLHPSSIQFMRDELLKMGKNNIILISTHSNFMVDDAHIERHLVIQKDIHTIAETIDEGKSLFNEEVVSRAFGLQLMKELIPENIILVEGKCDKVLIEIGLIHLSKNKSWVIKSGDGTKIHTYASILANEKFSPIIVLDADKGGTNIKRKILSDMKGSYTKNSVFTLRDLVSELPENSTIEDLYPAKFLSDFLKNEKGIDLDCCSITQPVLIEIKNVCNNYHEKEKIDELKTELSAAFIEKYRDGKNLEMEAQHLSRFIRNLENKF